MSTQRIYFSVVLCFFIATSCSNKKTRSAEVTSITSSKNFDTVAVLPDETLDIAGYNTAFTNNITQKFTVVPQKISVITGRKGLKVTVNPSVLEKEDGSAVDGKIKVKIIELTSSDELFKSNAATVSNGKLLASGGSYFIGMECNGQKLRIKKGKSLQMEFPQIKDDEMELFYGQRDVTGSMNWVKAGIGLKQQEANDLMFTDSNRFSSAAFLSSFAYDEKKELKLYKTLTDEVYYYNKKMTIKEIVDTINRHSKKIYIDTVYTWPKELAKLPKSLRVDTNYLNAVYGPRKQFLLKTCRDLQEEKERLAKQKAIRDSLNAAWQPQSLAGQIQKYYAPSAITALGWINCDRFYYSPQNTEVPLELPITFNNPEVDYFIICKSINGLMNGRLGKNTNGRYVLSNLPEGLAVTLVAFTKNNGQIFQCKEEFVIQKNKPVQLNFKNISPEEMTKIFGKNVRT